MNTTRTFIRTSKKFLNIRSQHNLRWSSVAATTDKQNIPLSEAKPFEEIPSLRVLPLVGTSWAFMPIIGRNKLNRLHLALRERRELLGDIYREKFGSLNIVIIFKPDDAETTFRNEGAFPSRGELESLKAYRSSRKQWYSSTGVMVLQGKEWWDLRSKVQKHLLKPKAIQEYLNPMQDVAKEFVEKMKRDINVNREVPNFLEELYKWALESVGLIGLDTRLGCLKSSLHPESDAAKIIKCSAIQFECMNHLEPTSGGLPFWKLFPTPTWRRFAKASDVFSEIVFRYINRALEELKNADDSKDLTLLQSMLMEKDLDASGALVMITDMLFAGIDTTSHTIGFFLYALARNPDKQELLYEEIKNVFPTKDQRITNEKLNELKYLKACIKESQRLHPILGGVTRLIDRDIVLSGYRVPAGTTVFPNFYEIGQDEQYFPEAKSFIPERWLSRDKTIHPFSFLPFGFGTRSCVGRRLAEFEIYCLTTEILRNFKVEYHHEDIGIHTRLIFVPDKPLRFTFTER